ncbi:OLC1v1031169C1 [Oldenlandia corymbosa var. corymbosa]|uniref:OLC1v1031169C1 n=1 Tax=Oldenlandia corymbosa var. corymbosa TaxID=529605 RepID=A0AAV1CJK2_OLDCO|nr:OLC1v1031169C1 [Oldenlandia corymbosa var. corymbosa]
MDTEMTDSPPTNHDKDNPATRKVKNRDHAGSESYEATQTTSTQNPQTQQTPQQESTIPVEGAPSFKDRLLQGQQTEFTNNFHMETVIVEDDDVIYPEEDGTPSIRFSDRVQVLMKRAMTYSVAVKPLGKEFRHDRLCKRLKGLWRAKGDVKPVDTVDGYHILRLTNEEDYHATLLNGPWSLDEAYILVLPWNQEFNTKEDNLNAAQHGFAS